MDVAKRLIDLGYHPPTVYFPLVVEEALMVEPTETESKETIDGLAAALNQIAAEAVSDPDLVKSAPVSTPVRRPDEARAALERPELLRPRMIACHIPASEGELGKGFYYRPTIFDRWVCEPDGCGAMWDTFATAAKCPACGAQFQWTACPAWVSPTSFASCSCSPEWSHATTSTPG